MRTELGAVKVYDQGPAKIIFVWDEEQRDGFAWSECRQYRLASYHRRRDVQAAFKRSNNTRGAYGCAELRL